MQGNFKKYQEKYNPKHFPSLAANIFACSFDGHGNTDSVGSP
jgi:hypothetical protein